MGQARVTGHSVRVGGLEISERWAGAVHRIFRSGVLIAVLLCVSGGVAGADPLPVADVSESANTPDGWHVSVALTNMTINSVPNMAATGLTREGFVTGSTIARIDGNGAIPVNSGNLNFGVQLGCQIDLSSGGSIGAFAVPIPVPFGGVTVLPGKILTVGFGSKALKGRTGEIDVQDTHVRVDGCGGPVSIRFIAVAQISTDNVDNTVSTYGDILTL
jgi:hypothetical protein